MVAELTRDLAEPIMTRSQSTPPQSGETVPEQPRFQRFFSWQALSPPPRRPSLRNAMRTRSCTASASGVPVLDLDNCDEEAASNATWFRVGLAGQAAPRLLDREAAFEQSSGSMKIRRLHTSALLRFSDMFHTLVYIGTLKVVLFVATLVVFSWIFFAWLFMGVSKPCGLDANSFVRALLLSIETMQTIGYGLPDPYFKDCSSGVFVLGASALWHSLLNAIFISIVYTRVSRGQRRASSVCFSEKAVICESAGKLYFMYQVCDFRKHQLCQTHIRQYSVQHVEGSTGVPFQTRMMRLQHPDDSLGSFVLPALPQVIVHCIDEWSPLYPSWCRQNHEEEAAGSSAGREFPKPVQRATDVDVTGMAPSRIRVEQVAQEILSRQLEVMCLLEGSDPLTSGTLQARHSYTCDDIVFNAYFKQCVHRGADGACEIDFQKFHSLIESPPNSAICPQAVP